MDELMQKAEAIIFAVGRAISEKEIADLAGASVSDVHGALNKLKKGYEERNSPLLIIQEGDGWKLTVHEKYLSLVQQITPHTELNRAILETLAVIAWKQPAKQSEVIKIRTTKAYEHIGELENLGFISKEKYGRTFLLKVTGKFFDYFDLPRDKGTRELFKDVKDVEEAQMKLFDQEQTKEGGLEVYDGREKQATKETVGGLEVFEDVGVEKEQEQTEKSPAKNMKEALEENPVDDFLKENKPKPAPQEVEEGIAEEESEKEEQKEEPEEKERELDPELEGMIKEKKKKKEE